MQHAIDVLKVARDTASQNREVAVDGGNLPETKRINSILDELDDAIDNLEYECHFRQRDAHDLHIQRLRITIGERRKKILEKA